MGKQSSLEERFGKCPYATAQSLISGKWAVLLLHRSINASLNDSKYDYKLSKYCSNEGNIYTESLGDLAYQNNPKFKKFIADNGLGFKPYAQFGKTEITERIQLLVQLVNLVWNTEMFA